MSRSSLNGQLRRRSGGRRWCLEEKRLLGLNSSQFRNGGRGITERFSAEGLETSTNLFWSIKMTWKSLFIAVMATLLVAVAGGNLLADQFFELNTYDFSEKANNTWNNYCAPTAAADVVYHFGKTYASLVKNNPYGPGAAADTGAQNITGDGIPANNGDPPGPPAGTLANLMGTTRNGGTTLNGLNVGLAQYLANNSNVAWNTQTLLAANFAAPKGANFLNALEADLSAGDDVILVVAWQGGILPGGGDYSKPNNYDVGQTADSPMGHAFEMYGYNTANGTISVNDPGNNVNGAQNWQAEANAYGVAVNPNNFTFIVGGATAIAYGAVVVQSPEPGSIALLLSAGAIGLLAVAWRRRTQLT
jgi:hypothetical protein